jgi:hypothetical protein
MRIILAFAVSLGLASLLKPAVAQTSSPSAFLLKSSYDERDSDITFAQLGFTPGEKLGTAAARLHTIHRRNGIEQNGNHVFLVPFSDVIWNGMRGAGWIRFDSADRAEQLHLEFKHETFDTMYLRLSRAYGLPDREFFLHHDSECVVTFHDNSMIIELGVDSSVTVPVIQAWAPRQGGPGIDTSRPRDKQWVSLGGGIHFTAFVDPDTPPSNEVVVKFVDDSEIAAVKIEAAEKYPTLGYDSYAYGLLTYKCDCEARTVSVLRILHCNSDDKPIYLYPPNQKRSQPRKAGDRGFDAALLDYVCSRIRRLGGE